MAELHIYKPLGSQRRINSNTHSGHINKLTTAVVTSNAYIAITYASECMKMTQGNMQSLNRS